MGVKQRPKVITAHGNSITFSVKARKIKKVIYKLKPKDKYTLANKYMRPCEECQKQQQGNNLM